MQKATNKKWKEYGTAINLPSAGRLQNLRELGGRGQVREDTKSLSECKCNFLDKWKKALWSDETKMELFWPLD